MSLTINGYRCSEHGIDRHPRCPVCFASDALEKSDDFYAVERRALEGVIEKLKTENHLLREALVFRGFDPEEEVHFQNEEKLLKILGIE
jgi:hypothetical protein